MKKPRAPPPPPLRIMISRKEAAKALSVSMVTLDGIIRSGELRAKKLGGRVLIHIAEIERYVGSLTNFTNESPPPGGGGQDNVEPIKPRAATP